MNAYKGNIGFSRTPAIVLLVWGLLGGSLVSEGWAEEYRRGDAAVVQEAEDLLSRDHGVVTVTMPPTDDPSNIAYAGLEFEVVLVAGDEIEVWLAGDGRELPWASASATRARPLARWTADPETGTVVCVDLTDLVRRSLSEERASVDLVVRRVPAAAEVAAALEFRTRVPPKMVYHLVRPDSRLGAAVEEALDPGFE